MKKTILAIGLVMVMSFAQGQTLDINSNPAKITTGSEKVIADTAFENLMNKKFVEFGQFLNDKFTKKDWDFIMQNLGILFNNAIIEWNNKKKKN